jgi:para-aminobenzoate synthetase component 1
MIIEEIALRIPPLEVLERLSRQPQLAYLEGLRDPRGRSHTVLGYAPRATFEIGSGGASIPGGAARGDALAALDTFLTTLPGSDPAIPFPFRCAAIGYLAYDLRTLVERVPARARDDLHLPRALFRWYDPFLIHDDSNHRYYLVSGGSRAVVNEARRRLFQELDAGTTGGHGEHSGAPRLESNMTRDEYRRAVSRIHDFIAAGDVYQINFTQRFCATMSTDPLALFVRLVRRHPMPRSAYIDAESFQILSNSPELFLERHGTRIATQPIKGTRRRGQTTAQDARQRAELRRDAKERAEHVMIIDLERNDLGRICRTGTVCVPHATRVHSYPTLHHLVSTVEGIVAEDVPTAEVIRATFPGGSITGAPKIRAMEIIDALEPNARGVYTGALGLIDTAGDMHLSLAIRTAVTTGGRIYYGTGGGIVADSDADSEYAESLLKAEGLLTALGATFGNGN